MVEPVLITVRSQANAAWMTRVLAESVDMDGGVVTSVRDRSP